MGNVHEHTGWQKGDAVVTGTESPTLGRSMRAATSFSGWAIGHDSNSSLREKRGKIQSGKCNTFSKGASTLTWTECELESKD